MDSKGKFKRGVWVARKDSDQPLFGTVKDALYDIVSVVAYDPRGHRVGRISPPEGGPATFEPGLTAEDFVQIQEPIFPLDRDLYGGWAHSLKTLDGQSLGRRRTLAG